jgi:hypothetical protein
MRLKLAPMGLDPRVYQKISFRWISQVKPGNDGIEFISLLSALSRVALRK